MEGKIIKFHISTGVGEIKCKVYKRALRFTLESVYAGYFPKVGDTVYFDVEESIINNKKLYKLNNIRPKTIHRYIGIKDTVIKARHIISYKIKEPINTEIAIQLTIYDLLGKLPTSTLDTNKPYVTIKLNSGGGVKIYCDNIDEAQDIVNRLDNLFSETNNYYKDNYKSADGKLLGRIISINKHTNTVKIKGFNGDIIEGLLQVKVANSHLYKVVKYEVLKKSDGRELIWIEKINTNYHIVIKNKIYNESAMRYYMLRDGFSYKGKYGRVVYNPNINIYIRYKKGKSIINLGSDKEEAYKIKCELDNKLNVYKIY